MKQDFGIVKIRGNSELQILEISTEEAKYKTIPWSQLGALGKRKFENLVVLSNPKQRCKIIYV